MSYKVLVVDDEEDIIEFQSYNLELQGWSVASARNGVEAIEVAQSFKPDLILMDVMMPLMDGITACGELRRMPSMNSVIIAMVTARSEDYSQIAGFEAGADDYIFKPIRPSVLISRIKALLKRRETLAGTLATPEQKETELPFEIDTERHLVITGDKEITLPRKEFALLSLLSSKPGKVFTREAIYDSVWGEEVVVGDRTIDVHIRKLRERLGDGCISTVKGVGYKINL